MHLFNHKRNDAPSSVWYSIAMTKTHRLVLIASILASFVAFLDGAIVNVALPAIQKELGGGLPAQQWIVDAYLLTLGSFILIAGSLSDLLGRKRILNLGLLGFAITSLLCAISPSSGMLIASRALQGIAGALLVPSSLAIIISNFKGPAQAKAIGTWTAWTGIAFVLGPLVGGILVDQASWRWIFAINVIPVALTLYLLSKLRLEEKIKPNAKVDFIGATLCALGLGGSVFALIEQSHYGWTSPLIYVPLILGAGLFSLFVMYEQKVEAPMLPLGLFRNRNFAVGNIATLAVYSGLGASTFLIVLFLQQVAKYSALEAGLATLPITIIMFFLSPRFGALSAKYGPRLFMGVGPLVSAAGFLVLLNADTQANYWGQIALPIVLFGLGLSMTVAPLTSAILGGIPEKEAGVASAANNAVARIAGLLAIAAVGAVISWQFQLAVDPGGHLLARGVSAPSEVTDKALSNPLVTDPPAPYQNDEIFKDVLTDASIQAFQSGVILVSVLLAAGGIVSLVGIRNPKST